MTQQQHHMPQPDPDYEDPGIPEHRPHKRSRLWLWIALGLAVPAMVTLGYLALYWGPSSSTPPRITSHTVVYQAEGVRTNAASFTLQAPTGTQQAEGRLPLQTAAGIGVTFTGLKSGAFVYISVQNSLDAGVVTCRILVDGVVVSENTSSGGYTIATCQGRVP